MMYQGKILESMNSSHFKASVCNFQKIRDINDTSGCEESCCLHTVLIHAGSEHGAFVFTVCGC